MGLGVWGVGLRVYGVGCRLEAHLSRAPAMAPRASDSWRETLLATRQAHVRSFHSFELVGPRVEATVACKAAAAVHLRRAT